MNTYQLAKMFGVSVSVICAIKRGKTYKAAGGPIRQVKPKPRVPDNIRAQIRAEYVYGSKEFGSTALAKKYGVGMTTVRRIVNASE